MGGHWELNAWSLFKSGGPIIYPILLCSVFAIGIVIEKIFYLMSIQTDMGELKRRVFDLIKDNKIKEAIEVCGKNPSPVGKILKAGLIKFGSDRDEIKENMDQASLYEIPKLENRLSALATIAHTCPLLGLLGTVMGMMSGFQTIQARAGSMSPVSPGDLAGSIGEALLTTAAGLMVAIPAYITYNFFINRVSLLVLEMEKAATELLFILFSRKQYR